MSHLQLDNPPRLPDSSSDLFPAVISDGNTYVGGRGGGEDSGDTSPSAADETGQLLPSNYWSPRLVAFAEGRAAWIIALFRRLGRITGNLAKVGIYRFKQAPLLQSVLFVYLGYLCATYGSPSPVRAPSFSNSGGVGALSRVPLTGQSFSAERDWRRFAASVTAPHVKIHHVTICTLPNPNLERLHASARWFGDQVTVLGMNDPRFLEWGKGFGVKLELLHQHVKTLPPDDVVVFTDAFDVIMMASQREVREAFLLTSRLALARDGGGPDPSGAFPARVPSIIFSAEFFCHPDGNRTVDYPASDSQYVDFPYLNSGTFVGTAGSILASFERFSNYTLQDDDQRYWTTVYLSSLEDATLPRIVLDHESDVFLCMNKYRVDTDLDFDPAARRFKYKGSNGLPMVIHFNGRKTDVPEMFELLSMRAPSVKVLVSRIFIAIFLGALFLVFPIGIIVGRALDGGVVLDEVK